MKMEAYKISIIVPVYNAEDYLERCVDSLLNQTYQNLEIILVDDGSDDDGGKMCNCYADKDERVKAVHKENGGLISAWKRGVQESTGEYLCFVDSDDWVDLRMIEELAGQLSGNEKEIISSDYVIEHEDGKLQYVWQTLTPGEYGKSELRHQVIPQILGNERRPVCMSRCMKLIGRILILDNMKYSNPAIHMGEDTTIMLPSLMDCERLVIMDHKAWYHYAYVTSSMVHKYDKGMYANMKLLREIILHIITEKLVGLECEQLKKQADKEYILLLLLVIKNEARGNPKGYRSNIAAVCSDKEIEQLIKHTPVVLADRANKLLYLTLRYPNTLTVSMLRLAMIVYYRKG